MVGDDLAEVVRVTTIATEGLHQPGETGLVFDYQVQHPLVEIRALIPPVAAGDVKDVLLRLLITVIAAIDMEAGAIAMGERWDKPQALGGRSRNEAAACRHPISIERIEGTAKRVIIEMTGWNARSDKVRERRRCFRGVGLLFSWGV